MRAIIGVTLLILGMIGAGIIFVFNGSTPLQIGPIPFFACVFIAVIGLIITIVAMSIRG